MKLATFYCLTPLILCGCAIQKFNKPEMGWASTVVHHSRFFGLSASYSGYGIKMGWGSEVVEIIPVSTNKVFAAPVSDTFRIGQSINPFNTVITEDIVSGWDGTPPAPRYNQLFHPPDKIQKPLP